MIEHAEGIYNFYVYILTNKNKTALYIGVTNDLKRCLKEHKEKINQKVLLQGIMFNFCFIMNISLGYSLLLLVRKKSKI